MINRITKKVFVLANIILAVGCLTAPLSLRAADAPSTGNNQSTFDSAGKAKGEFDVLVSEVQQLVGEVAAGADYAASKPKADQVMSKSNEAIAKANSILESVGSIAANLKSAGGAEAQKGTQLDQALQATDAIVKGASAQMTTFNTTVGSQISTKQDLDLATAGASGALQSVASSINSLLSQAATLAGLQTQAGTGVQTGGTTGAAPQGQTFELENPLHTTSIPVILGNVIKMFLGVVGALALLVFVYGGILYMTARGDSAQSKKAMDTLKYAVLGLIIIAGSYTITNNYVNIWTSSPIPATGSRTAAGAQPTQSEEEAQQLQTSVQDQAAQEAAAQAAAEAEAQQVANDTKHWAEQMGCTYLIHHQDPSNTYNYSCMKTAGINSNVYACYKLNPDPCATDESCCTKP